VKSPEQVQLECERYIGTAFDYLVTQCNLFARDCESKEDWENQVQWGLMNRLNELERESGVAAAYRAAGRKLYAQ
jgi:hypothetical protein